MSETSKLAVETIVTQYVTNNPDEFKVFSVSAKAQKETLKNSFAEVKDGAQYVERKLYEVPETLYILLKFRMDEEAFKWLQTKEGGRWFAKKYPVFASGEKV